MRGVVDATLIESFRGDGAVCLRGALSADDVALIERGIERNLESPSARALVASREDDPGRFFEDFCNWEVSEELEQVIREWGAAPRPAELWARRTVRLFHDHVFVKE